VSGGVVGTALRRLADELTAVLGGLLGYVAVLAALGVMVIYLLEIDGVSAAMEPGPRSDQAAVERPDRASAFNGNRIEVANRPELRRTVAAR
jgi:hypothetical protein